MSSPARRLVTPPATWALVFATASFGAVLSEHAQAGAAAEARVETGARLFRAMLAADTEIEKKTDAEGALRIAVVHAGDDDRARVAVELVARRDLQKTPEPIRGLPVRVESARVDELPGLSRRAVGAIFIAEPLRRDALAAVIQFAVERHVITYSAFEGDVELGVSGGLSVEAQVRPYVNAEALRTAQVTLREFFLRVAKVRP